MYPNATPAERIADGAVHIIGLLAALIASAMLLMWANVVVSAGMFAALAVYCATLIASLAASGVYNMMPYDAPRPMLRRIDHAAIYLIIAGTYGPLVVMLDTTFGYVILAVVWALGVIGVIRKLFFWQIPGKFGTALYLIMGWLSVFLIWSLIPVAPSTVVWLIAAGGLLYTAGVPVYLAKTMPFSTPIWHAIVVIASACFFAAITLGAQI